MSVLSLQYGCFCFLCLNTVCFCFLLLFTFALGVFWLWFGFFVCFTLPFIIPCNFFLLKARHCIEQLEVRYTGIYEALFIWLGIRLFSVSYNGRCKKLQILPVTLFCLLSLGFSRKSLSRVYELGGTTPLLNMHIIPVTQGIETGRSPVPSLARPHLKIKSNKGWGLVVEHSWVQSPVPH